MMEFGTSTLQFDHSLRVSEELALPWLNSAYPSACWLAQAHADAKNLFDRAYLNALAVLVSFEPRHQLPARKFSIRKNIFLTVAPTQNVWQELRLMLEV
jgi:hypothetical protein